jgi:hypothetical protein
MSLNFHRAAIAASFVRASVVAISFQSAVALAGDTGWVQIADSVADFSGTQGENGWTYGYADGRGEQATVYEMAYFGPPGNCGCPIGDSWHFAETVCFCGQEFCYINAGNQHGDTQGDEHVPVRRYTFSESGRHLIDASFSHQGGCGGNNPVRVELRRAGQVLWSAESSPSTVTGSVELIVAAGDTVELWTVMLASECGNNHAVSLKVSKADCNGDKINDWIQIQDGSLPDYDGDMVPDCCDWAGPCVVGGYPKQWKVADGGNGHWYMILPEVSASWADSAAEAAAVGSHLATFNNLFEFDWAMANIMYSCAGCKVWIGATQASNGAEPAGGWAWSTGESPFAVRWYENDPSDATGNEDCGAIKSTGSYKGLTDQNCASTYAPMVEWDADCNGDGIVDLGQILDGTYADADANAVPDICEFKAARWVENGHWYGTISEPFTWETGKSAAESVGGHLVTLSDAWEDEWFENLAINPAGVSGEWWIGGSQAADAASNADGWSWVDGTPFTYSGWYPGYPNHAGQSALAKKVVWGQLGAQIDLDPASIRYAAVEWDQDCNLDGIVDFGQIFSGDLEDRNHNLVPDLCECAGDVVLDGRIDGVDLAALLALWGTDGSGAAYNADLDDDGIIGGGDLGLLLAAWGTCTN